MLMSRRASARAVPRSSIWGPPAPASSTASRCRAASSCRGPRGRSCWWAPRRSRAFWTGTIARPVCSSATAPARWSSRHRRPAPGSAAPRCMATARRRRTSASRAAAPSIRRWVGVRRVLPITSRWTVPRCSSSPCLRWRMRRAKRSGRRACASRTSISSSRPGERAHHPRGRQALGSRSLEGLRRHRSIRQHVGGVDPDRPLRCAIARSCAAGRLARLRGVRWWHDLGSGDRGVVGLSELNLCCVGVP